MELNKRQRGYQPPWDEVFQHIEDNPDGMSLEDIGKVFGLTRERIRQIELDALAKIKAGGEGGKIDFGAWAEHKPAQSDGEHTVLTGNRVRDEPPDDVNPLALTMSPRSIAIERAIQDLEASADRFQRSCEPLRDLWVTVSIESLDRLQWVALHSERYGRCEILERYGSGSDWWLVRLPHGLQEVVHKDNFVQDYEVQMYTKLPVTIAEFETLRELMVDFQ